MYTSVRRQLLFVAIHAHCTATRFLYLCACLPPVSSLLLYLRRKAELTSGIGLGG